MTEVLLAILVLGFAPAGVAKLAGIGGTRENFQRWVVPEWSRPIVGAVEIGIAIAAIAGIFGSGAGTQIAALLALWVMVGAVVVHAMAGDKVQQVAPAIVLLIAALLVLFTQET